jgi:hypothetical protein
MVVRRAQMCSKMKCRKKYLCYGQMELVPLLITQLRNSYVFEVGTKAWVELRETEGRLVVSFAASASPFLNIVCHFVVVILSRSLNKVCSEGDGLPSRWYIVVACWQRFFRLCCVCVEGSGGASTRHFPANGNSGG